jgi:hypothetical protein
MLAARVLASPCDPPNLSKHSEAQLAEIRLDEIEQIYTARVAARAKRRIAYGNVMDRSGLSVGNVKGENVFGQSQRLLRMFRI